MLNHVFFYTFCLMLDGNIEGGWDVRILKIVISRNILGVLVQASFQYVPNTPPQHTWAGPYTRHVPLFHSVPGPRYAEVHCIQIPQQQYKPQHQIIQHRSWKHCKNAFLRGKPVVTTRGQFTTYPTVGLTLYRSCLQDPFSNKVSRGESKVKN